MLIPFKADEKDIRNNKHHVWHVAFSGCVLWGAVHECSSVTTGISGFVFNLVILDEKFFLQLCLPTSSDCKKWLGWADEQVVLFWRQRLSRFILLEAVPRRRPEVAAWGSQLIFIIQELFLEQLLHTTPCSRHWGLSLMNTCSHGTNSLEKAHGGWVPFWRKNMNKISLSQVAYSLTAIRLHQNVWSWIRTDLNNWDKKHVSWQDWININVNCTDHSCLSETRGHTCCVTFCT